MTSLASLWLPILLSAVFVFIASSIIHMVLKYHASDRGPAPDEEAVRAALRMPAGDYVVPYASSMEAMKSPEHTTKLAEGPVAFITVLPTGSWNMGRALGLWFVYCLVVSIVAGYVAGRALLPGADYLAVFRFVGTTAFAGYVLALWQETIWYGRSVTTTLKNTLDGVIFALITAGVFGWLWPS
ncbi:MAG TPA: hypothetical protein VK929_09240 [Longimicrobiales bacterium]|nr:hypothetical protein [Longimicrobiales bacterium]